jgi:hypothetical protein
MLRRGYNFVDGSGSVNSSPHPCPSGVLPCKRPVDTPGVVNRS